MLNSRIHDMAKELGITCIYNFQFAEVIISWKNINVLVVDISPITFHQAKTAGIFALSVFGRMTHSLLLMMTPATLTME